MGDEEGAPYSWTSTEPLLEGVEEAPSGPWVKQSGKGKVVYPNGDTFEGTFNDKLEKHGRGVYTWGTAVGNNPWVPEEGFPGACAAFAHGSRRPRCCVSTEVVRAAHKSFCLNAKLTHPSLSYF